MRKYVYPLFLFLLLDMACKSPPPVSPPPEQRPAGLEFERIEAESVSRIALFYRLKVENPRQDPLEIEIRGWKLSLNEAELGGNAPGQPAASVTLDEKTAAGSRFSAGPGASVEKTLVLNLDLSAPAQNTAALNTGEYRTILSLDMIYRYGGGDSLTAETAASVVFPRIREPEFTITSIAIMQAELINTRFKVNLKIDNPNMFPISLSSLNYELYGSGRFWADGTEQAILDIPAQDSAEKELLLVMNFINMKRSLLDEIIAMRQVPYRFTGEAEVRTGVSWLPRFRIGFDRSGDSAVVK